MPSTYLGLWNAASTNKAFSAVYHNQHANAADNLGMAHWRLFARGAKSGWVLPQTVGKSAVTSGHGLVGPAYCRTVASQVISGLFNGTNYLHAITDSSSAWNRSVKFVARATSAPVTNADGQSTGILLGKLVRNALTGVASVDSTLRERMFGYRWLQQRVTTSLTAGPTTARSANYTFPTAMKIVGGPASIPAQASCGVKVHSVTNAGFTAEVYNRNSNAAATYAQTLTWYGLIGDS